MKQLIAVQAADGMRLEEVNPYFERAISVKGLWKKFEDEKQSFLTDDPTVVAGEKYDEEEFEPISQAKNRYDPYADWFDVNSSFQDRAFFARQILRRKAEGEKEVELNGWISVKDRLPELLQSRNLWNNDDLCLIKWEKHDSLELAVLTEGEGVTVWEIPDHGYAEMNEVNYWMPIPKSPIY